MYYKERTPSGEWTGEVCLRERDVENTYFTTGRRGGDSSDLYLLFTNNDSVNEVYFRHGVTPLGVEENNGILMSSGGDISVRGFHHISYSVKQPGPVRLAVYDVMGRMVKLLVAGNKEKGIYEVRIPEEVVAGVYFIRLDAEDVKETKKVVLFR